MFRMFQVVSLALALSVTGCVEEEEVDAVISYEFDDESLERDVTGDPGSSSGDSWCECCDSKWNNCREASCSSICGFKQKCEKAADGTSVCTQIPR